MKVTLKFDAGELGDLDIDTNTDHGNPDKVFLDGEDITDNGPMIDVLLKVIGPISYQARLQKAQEIAKTIDPSDAYKKQRDLQLEQEGA